MRGVADCLIEALGLHPRPPLLPEQDREAEHPDHRLSQQQIGLQDARNFAQCSLFKPWRLTPKASARHAAGASSQPNLSQPCMSMRTTLRHPILRDPANPHPGCVKVGVCCACDMHVFPCDVPMHTVHINVFVVGWMVVIFLHEFHANV